MNHYLITLIVIALFLLVTFTIYHFIKAPEGYEDDGGFHIGKDDENK